MLPTQMELDVVVRNAIETLTYVNQFVFITQAYVQLITVSYLRRVSSFYVTVT